MLWGHTFSISPDHFTYSMNRLKNCSFSPTDVLTSSTSSTRCSTALRVTHCQWQFRAFPSPCYSQQLPFISSGTVVIMFSSSCDTSAWTISLFLPSRAEFLTWALWTPEPVCSRRWRCPRNRRLKCHRAPQASTSSLMGTVPCDHLQRAKV